MRTYLMADSRTERLLAPGRLDVYPHPEQNPQLTYAADARWARAWYGFVLRAWHTKDGRLAWDEFEAEVDAPQEDTRHLGVCRQHLTTFPKGEDCPLCAAYTAWVAAAIYAPEPRMPWGDEEDVCAYCHHPGYDGHDMRSVPPTCMTPGCPCGMAVEAVGRWTKP